MSYRHAYEKISEYRVRCMCCYCNIITLDKPAPDSLEYLHYYSCDLCSKEDEIITNSGYYEFKDRTKQERFKFKVGKFNHIFRYQLDGNYFLQHTIVNILKVCPKSIVYEIYDIDKDILYPPCRRKITYYCRSFLRIERMWSHPTYKIEGIKCFIDADDLYLMNDPWIEEQKIKKKQKEAVEIISNAFLEWKYNPIYKYCQKIQQRLYEEEYEPNKAEFKKIITEDMRLKLKSLNLTTEELYEFINE